MPSDRPSTGCGARRRGIELHPTSHAVHPYLLLVALIGGFVVAIYPKVAPRRGWRVAPAFRQSGGAIASAGFASMAAAAIFILLRSAWWEAALLLVAGPVVGLILMHLLKSTVQRFALALIAFGWLWLALIEIA